MGSVLVIAVVGVGSGFLGRGDSLELGGAFLKLDCGVSMAVASVVVGCPIEVLLGDR